MFVYFWIGKWSANLYEHLVEKRRDKKYDELLGDAQFLEKEQDIYNEAYESGYHDGYNHVTENKGI